MSHSVKLILAVLHACVVLVIIFLGTFWFKIALSKKNDLCLLITGIIVLQLRLCMYFTVTIISE